MKRFSIAVHAFLTVLIGGRCVFHSDYLEYFHGNKEDNDNAIKLLEDGFTDLDVKASRIRYWRNKVFKPNARSLNE